MPDAPVPRPPRAGTPVCPIPAAEVDLAVRVLVTTQPLSPCQPPEPE